MRVIGLLLLLLVGCTRAPQETVVSQAVAEWWRPSSSAPLALHWQLDQDFQVPRDVRPGVWVYDFDGETASAQEVQRLKAWGAAQGKQVIAICYIDVGVFENYRSDLDRFYQARDELRRRTGNPNARLWGNRDRGWAGSWWLDVRQIDLLIPIMEARIRDWCKAKGFDAVEPDETEVWNNNPGFPISMEQSHAYTRAIADLVHRYGMSVGLKGNTGEAALLEPWHDWALSEECFQYGECDNLRAFSGKGKAVFIVEYKGSLPTARQCAKANREHWNVLRRDLNLVGPSKSAYRYRSCTPEGAETWNSP